MTSKFDKAYHKNSQNSTFVTNIKEALLLDKLLKRVAPNAILNSGGRVDEPRCHPGTRKEVIGRVEKWGDGQNGSTAPMFWLSGPAGAGKSAIVQTIAEHCDEHGVPHANFFFFKADSSRSQLYPLVATLVHQIISLYPSFRNVIATMLHHNPAIVDTALKDQLTQLIVAPLQTIQQSSPAYRPLLLLIDGLDECDSEGKLSQQQILQAFDAIFEKYSQPFPIRILISSRTEPQIQTAFNNLSSQYIFLYLDNTYSPANDIRKFVIDEFQRVRKTHRLRHTLNATWPPIEDVNYIVEKSSGQFIFAATAVRLISESSAAPTISLDRIKGVTQLAQKSPFSHLDAIYTYILMQVDDQDALKDILTAGLLLNQIASSLSTGQLLELYNRKYTTPMVDSCLVDLTPIAWYIDNKLKFHHVCFFDFLLDRSRSSGSFVDIAAFAFKVLPVVCKRVDDSADYRTFVKSAISKLERLPPGLLGPLASSKSFIDSIEVSDAGLIGKLNQLCINDDDIAGCRKLCRQWIERQIDHFRSIGNRKDIRDIPFGDRYYQMALAERFMGAPTNITDTSKRGDIIAIALDTNSDFNRHEAALWLRDLLRDMHRKKYLSNPESYRKRVKAWILWAVQNDISLDGPGDQPPINATSQVPRESVDIPYSRRYFAMARVQRYRSTLPTGPDATSLRPESDFDREESALWLKELLCDMHGKMYSGSRDRYRELLKAWVFWAVQNHIRLDCHCNWLHFRQSVNVPYSCRYFAMARVQHNHATPPTGSHAISLRPESDFDRQESALWLDELLHDMHSTMYSGSCDRYRELLKAWVFWAVLNNIHLDNVGPKTVDLPYSHRYFAMARIQCNHATPPTGPDAISLRPESDFDRQESSLWLVQLLYDMHRKIRYSSHDQYRDFVKAWAFWAVQNDIRLDCPGNGHVSQKYVDIPYCRRYFSMAHIQRYHGTPPTGLDATSLLPESNFDREESALWLDKLLCDMHSKMYPSSCDQYRELLKAWAFWAVQNDIPSVQNDIPVDCPGNGHVSRKFIDLPYSCRYFAMARVQRNHTTPPTGPDATSLRPESDLDCQESALWLDKLLCDMYIKMYASSHDRYKELSKAWVFWAVQNDIRLDRSGNWPDAHASPMSVNLPYILGYFGMAEIERTYAVMPKRHVTTALSPDADFDCRESALQREDLLHDTRSKGHLRNFMPLTRRNDSPSPSKPKAVWDSFASAVGTAKSFLRTSAAPAVSGGIPKEDRKFLGLAQARHHVDDRKPTGEREEGNSD